MTPNGPWRPCYRALRTGPFRASCARSCPAWRAVRSAGQVRGRPGPTRGRPTARHRAGRRRRRRAVGSGRRAGNSARSPGPGRRGWDSPGPALLHRHTYDASQRAGGSLVSASVCVSASFCGSSLAEGSSSAVPAHVPGSGSSRSCRRGGGGRRVPSAFQADDGWPGGSSSSAARISPSLGPPGAPGPPGQSGQPSG